jgi:hypothetical protein
MTNGHDELTAKVKMTAGARSAGPETADEIINQHPAKAEPSGSE